MSKLAKRFLLSLSAVLVLVILCSLYLNSNFIERYFLYQEKQDLKAVCEKLARSDALSETIGQLEQTEDVFIVSVENTSDNDLLNSRLRAAFQDKGLGFQKLWLWEPDQQAVAASGPRLRVYGQDKLHYSLLVSYLEHGESMVAAVKIIPAMKSTISLVNFVTALVFSGATCVILLLIYFLVKKITAPLAAIGDTAKAIAGLDFQTVSVNTGDELEVLAHDINDMSFKLQAAHSALEYSKLQMETLLANVSHDLKTPVSLIKAYASGMQDGMDDGTFLNTIILQNEKMEQMIERLLDLARLQSGGLLLEPVDLSALLLDIVSEQRLQAQELGLSFQCEITPATLQSADGQAVRTIFSNLISNAVKYADGGVIHIILSKNGGACRFVVENNVSPETPLEEARLWEPFYVAEQSRNKNISGTGLGLPIVRAAAQKCGYGCTCELLGQSIRFTIQF